jgi:predicted nucleic acid-binding protein
VDEWPAASSEDIWNAAALARKYNCPLVTGDPEFRSVDRLELDWIGDR